ncbi:hypothetical protein BTVI_101641 [Pitangus sulphuratus]|nr:hypothetical protein BTVI_101641 [Pitangus sulphuratus]
MHLAVLALDLGSLVHDRHKHTGARSTKDCKDDEDNAEEERLRGLGLFFLKKAQGCVKNVEPGGSKNTRDTDVLQAVELSEYGHIEIRSSLPRKVVASVAQLKGIYINAHSTMHTISRRSRKPSCSRK